MVRQDTSVRLERLTAADAEIRQRHLAAALAAQGLRAGDRVGMVAHGSADLLCLVLGALRTGIVPVVVNPALLAAEVDVLLADAEVSLVLDDAGVARWGDRAASACTGQAGGARVGGTLVDLAPAPLARPMHYTSGTTGVAKGVHSGLLDDRAAAALLAEERDLWDFGPRDVHLCCAPMHHSAPLRFSAGVLLAGGDVVVVAPFDAVTTARAIVHHAPTTTFMAPTHLQRLLAHDPDLSLDSFRLVAHAGAPCPEPLKRQVIERCGAGVVWEFYGSTEGQFTACPASDWLARPGTVGRARPGRHLHVDGDGVIWCSVPPHARFEYWRDPTKTAAAWRGDAFTVGDLGRLDADGFLYLDGRREDLVITGGVNVYPAEVERVLHGLPGLVDVAVFGADDETWGQRVCAAVVGEDLDPAAVLSWARGHLAGYKCPKQVVVLDELPRTATGKVRRSTLATDLGIAAP